MLEKLEFLLISAERFVKTLAVKSANILFTVEALEIAPLQSIDPFKAERLQSEEEKESPLEVTDTISVKPKTEDQTKKCKLERKRMTLIDEKAKASMAAESKLEEERKKEEERRWRKEVEEEREVDESLGKEDQEKREKQIRRWRTG